MMRLSNIHIFIQVQLWKLESGICIVVDHIHVFRHPNLYRINPSRSEAASRHVPTVYTYVIYMYSLMDILPPVVVSESSQSPRT
jgi:hypothetical protein